MAAYVVGSRGSALARAQVRGYLRAVRERVPAAEFTRRVIVESGDRDRLTVMSRSAAGGSGFSSEQEAALARGEVDVVVHSLKDLPTANPPGLTLLPPPGREDVHDALCGATLASLRKGARVGTGAPRRAAQLRAVRPDLDVVPIRGNVPPRLRMLETHGLDAVVLAAAGLRRLGLEDAIGELLPLDRFPPSPGQGALGIQVRTDAASAPLRAVLATTADPAADAAVRAERSLLAALHGGCNVPVAAHATLLPTGTLTLSAQITSLDGTTQLTATRTAPTPTTTPESLGTTLATDLIAQGAHTILAAARADLGAG